MIDRMMWRCLTVRVAAETDRARAAVSLDDGARALAAMGRIGASAAATRASLRSILLTTTERRVGR